MPQTLSLLTLLTACFIFIGCGGEPGPPAGDAEFAETDDAELAAEAKAVLGPPPSVVLVSDEAPTGRAAFAVPDMHCMFVCGPEVQQALATVAGVTKVETVVTEDPADRSAFVWTTDAFDVDAAVAAIEAAGFTATSRPEGYEPPAAVGEPEA